jgi:hypothetical protein
MAICASLAIWAASVRQATAMPRDGSAAGVSMIRSGRVRAA